MKQMEFIPPDSPVPPGNTASWFTELAWFLQTERELIDEGFLPRPTDLDPCGHCDAPVTREIVTRCNAKFWTVKTNGLKRDWSGHVVFCNPDYAAEAIELMLARLADPVLGPLMHGRWALVPAWTDRGWWHRHIEPGRRSGAIDVRFVEGRLSFGWPGNPTGLGGDTAKFPSAVVAWRRRVGLQTPAIPP